MESGEEESAAEILTAGREERFMERMDDMENNASKVKLIECKSCGAHFDEMLPACPYCGTMSIKGAEAQYMDKLEDIREDMEDLTNIPVVETKKAIKKQTKFVLIIIGVLLGVFAFFVAIELIFGYKEPQRDRQADFAWQQENFPMFDELYEQQKDGELLDKYYEALAEEAPIYAWEHYEYVSALALLADFNYILDIEAKGESLNKYDYQSLLYAGFRVETYEKSTAYTEEELERLQPYIERVREDFRTRWKFTDEELDYFEEQAENNYGLVPYDVIEDYIKDWMKEEGK